MLLRTHHTSIKHQGCCLRVLPLAVCLSFGRRGSLLNDSVSAGCQAARGDTTVVVLGSRAGDATSGFTGHRVGFGLAHGSYSCQIPPGIRRNEVHRRRGIRLVHFSEKVALYLEAAFVCYGFASLY